MLSKKLIYEAKFALKNCFCYHNSILIVFDFDMSWASIIYIYRANKGQENWS